ncbi:MAG: type II toxin-antitoxin system death-on-curing family toxin [Acidobacteriia bacterium]|nr:type II toxin-antitoxin system death-on-curing family toxin [Terriglobia bacterium]
MTSGESVPWRWVSLEVVLAVHGRQIAEHGGADGIRDLGLIESALARPANLMSYGDPDAASLAAAYAHGLVPNHGFVDGNKRVAWVTARLFLLANGWKLIFDPFDAIRIMESASAGQVSEEDVANWFRTRLAA